MINAKFEDSKFFLEMTNIVRYAEGFLEGVQAGKPTMLAKAGLSIKNLAEEYIDTMARVDPQSLHHVYEWYQTGSPNARLFNIDYSITNGGLSFNTTFSQSRSVANGASTPFYDKAYIMENGIPITIAPKSSDVLVFEDANGETVFTKSPININNPGGDNVQGSMEETLKTFFTTYLSQSYLSSSGFSKHLENPIDFKVNLTKAKNGGKSAGKQIGYNWIVKAGDKL